MEFTFIVLGIIVAAIAGFVIGQKTSQGSQEKIRLQNELNEKKQELEAFQAKVTNHFEKTATLFNHVSDSYQSLYDHMAKSSTQLCASQTFHGLPKSPEAEELPQAKLNKANKTNLDAQNMFDAHKLYNAHDYRNQQEEAEELIKESEKAAEQNANVVAIESAKDEPNEPALDYAIKPKGVINHNSLDHDNIKKSES
ncbi:YhcB family protein [Aliikangiella sp. IMCC44653]